MAYGGAYQQGHGQAAGHLRLPGDCQTGLASRKTRPDTGPDGAKPHADPGAKKRRRLPGLRGGKPRKVNECSGSPDSTAAITSAAGPGTIVTSRPCSWQCRTSENPGSAMPGVPPSETSATSSPDRSRERIGRSRSDSLKRWHETVGVVVAPAGNRWRARIVTYPSDFWTVSRGTAVMKFYADDPESAEKEAIDHIEAYIQKSGLTRAAEFLPVRFGSGADPDGKIGRRLCGWKIRFGHNTMNQEAVLGNASERGLFVQTENPLPAGSVVRLELDADGTRIPLRGTVAWVRVSRDTGRLAGMGVRLVRPPAMYLDSVKKLT